MAFVLVAETIFLFIFAHRTHLSRQQKKKIEEAKQMDAAKTEAIRQELSGQLATLRKRRNELVEKKKHHLAVAKQMDVVGENDLNASTVSWLIHHIENHRADTISEALMHYDAKMAAERKAASDRALKQAMDEIERKRQVDQLFADFKRDLDDIQHKKTMKNLEEKKLEELRRIREELER